MYQSMEHGTVNGSTDQNPDLGRMQSEKVRQLLGNHFIEHGRLVPPALRDGRRKWETNKQKAYGKNFGRHLGLLWKDLTPHLRVLLPDLFKKFKKKDVSPNFITNVLAPMVDDIFLRVDLRKKDYEVYKYKESIAFFCIAFQTWTNSSCACAEQRTHQEAEGREGLSDSVRRLD